MTKGNTETCCRKLFKNSQIYYFPLYCFTHFRNKTPPGIRNFSGSDGFLILKLYEIIMSCVWNQDSSVGIVTGYGLEGWRVGVQILVGQEFSFLHVIHTGPGVHPTFYTIGNKGSFLRGKAAGTWSWPPTNAEVKKMWIYTSTPHMPSRQCLIS
jgi:hypothetical protein